MVQFAETIHDFHIPARTGKGFRVAKGDLVRITDLEGDQPCDFWAFSAENPREFLSPEHTKPSIGKVCPKQGDAAHTNYRRAIVTLVEDNSVGNHDMQFAACDDARYVELGAPMPHPSCQGNLHMALEALGIDFDGVIQPWNLFTNFFLLPDGRIEIRAPGTKGGDNVVLRAEMDAYIVVSACPQDMNATCGGAPSDLRVEVGRA